LTIRGGGLIGSFTLQVLSLSLKKTKSFKEVSFPHCEFGLGLVVKASFLSVSLLHGDWFSAY